MARVFTWATMCIGDGLVALWVETVPRGTAEHCCGGECDESDREEAAASEEAAAEA